jgi:hypothetical protein
LSIVKAVHLDAMALVAKLGGQLHVEKGIPVPGALQRELVKPPTFHLVLAIQVFLLFFS